ncbi:MAG: hypothetical protein KBT87_14590 [Gammaproteobacteria bacterium]|nr:hypothetical protein [Gammaproteobacteria bacterium]
MKIEKIKISEILNSSIKCNFYDLRDDVPVAVSVPILNMGYSIISILSPRDHIFWNVGLYSAFRFPLYDGLHRLRSDPVFISGLQYFLSSLDEDRHSDVAIHLGGQSFAVLGGGFEPIIGRMIPHSGRVLGFIVPDRECDNVAGYFSNQFSSFGETATRKLSEKEWLYASRELMNDNYFICIGSPLSRLSEVEVEEAIALLKNRPSDFFDSVPIQYWNPGLISVFPPEGGGLKCVEKCLELTRLRLQLAFDYSPLWSVESLIERDVQGWRSVPMGDEMVDEFEEKLERLKKISPVVLFNPLSLNAS